MLNTSPAHLGTVGVTQKLEEIHNLNKDLDRWKQDAFSSVLSQIYQRNYLNPMQGRPKGIAMVMDQSSEERKSYFNYVRRRVLTRNG